MDGRYGLVGHCRHRLLVRHCERIATVGVARAAGDGGCGGHRGKTGRIKGLRRWRSFKLMLLHCRTGGIVGLLLAVRFVPAAVVTTAGLLEEDAGRGDDGDNVDSEFQGQHATDDVTDSHVT